MKESMNDQKNISCITAEQIKNLPEVKLIALDLDGTTLTRHGLGAETKRVLEESATAGIEVVIATGRAYNSLPEDILALDGINYLITSNGAHITDANTGETIYSDCIAADRIDEIHDSLKESGFGIEVFARGIPMISQKYYDDVKRGFFPYLSRKYIMETRKPTEDIYGFILDNKEEIENINVHFEFLSDREAMREKLEKIEGITVTSSVPHNLEIGGENTSKATAVRKICRMEDIDLENVMAFGDNPNDITMITVAGIGIAMGNGEPEVKESADFVTLTNDEEGVAFAIRKMVLEKNKKE